MVFDYLMYDVCIWQGQREIQNCLSLCTKFGKKVDQILVYVCNA